MTARINVDRAACKLHAECAAQAPDIFAGEGPFSVVHEDTRQVKQSGKPGDDRKQMQRFDPEHDGAP